MPGYVMSADEINYWQDMAALLDPAAYEWVLGTSQTRTVSGGERWYLINGWFIQATGGGASFFHRVANVYDALPLSEGTSLTTDDGTNTSVSFMYLCKPSLVTGGDSRYTSDPRALFFSRIQRIATLTQYTLGATNTGSGDSDATFPTDFTNGLIVHTSEHDISWMGLLNSAATAAMNLNNEIGDANTIRFAQSTIIPFVRTTFTKVRVHGASLAAGRGTVRYLKLDSLSPAW